MPKRGENIYKRSDGRWEGRYAVWSQPEQKRKYCSVYAKTYTEVKQKLTQARRELALIPPPRWASNGYTVQEWLTLWLSHYVRFSVKDSTYANYYYRIQTHVLSQLGDRKLGQLSTYELQLYFNEKRESGRLDGKGGLAVKTVKDLRTILSAAFAQAVSNGILAHNPCANIKLVDKQSGPLRVQVLSRREQSVLERHVLFAEERLSIAIVIALYTGMRLGEVCALRWENVDLINEILHVTENLQRIKLPMPNGNSKTKVSIGTPKSKCSVRDIPLPGKLVAYLSEYKLSAGDFPYVIPGRENQYVDPRSIQNYLAHLRLRLNLPKVSFHTLRHTFATRAVEVGMDVKTLSEILGHADVSVTLKKYVHSLPQHKREQIKKLEMLCLDCPSN